MPMFCLVSGNIFEGRAFHYTLPVHFAIYVHLTHGAITDEPFRMYGGRRQQKRALSYIPAISFYPYADMRGKQSFFANLPI